jgi:hypothetical protein
MRIKQEVESFFRKKNIRVTVMEPLNNDITYVFYNRGKKRFQIRFNSLEIVQNSKEPMKLIAQKYKEAIGVRLPQ